MDIATEIATHLVGRRLIDIKRRNYDWLFKWPDEVGLGVVCPWRIIVEGRITYGSEDDGQRFGVEEPVDGQDKARALLLSQTIWAVSLRPDTADLTITFDGRTTLEIINASAGFEGWGFHAKGLNVIAQGGGKLAVFKSAVRLGKKAG